MRHSRKRPKHIKTYNTIQRIKSKYKKKEETEYITLKYNIHQIQENCVYTSDKKCIVKK